MATVLLGFGAGWMIGVLAAMLWLGGWAERLWSWAAESPGSWSFVVVDDDGRRFYLTKEEVEAYIVTLKAGRCERR